MRVEINKDSEQESEASLDVIICRQSPPLCIILTCSGTKKETFYSISLLLYKVKIRLSKKVK